MPALVTLSTTTITEGVSASDQRISVGSTSGLYTGTRLWIERELLTVVSLGVNTIVNVIRGVDGTASAAHPSGSVVTIGRADQFYSTDPLGRPNDTILVSPWINIITGDTWYAQGDTLPNGANRWWQKMTTTYASSPLGIQTTTQDPTSST